MKFFKQIKIAHETFYTNRQHRIMTYLSWINSTRHSSFYSHPTHRFFLYEFPCKIVIFLSLWKSSCGADNCSNGPIDYHFNLYTKITALSIHTTCRQQTVWNQKRIENVWIGKVILRKKIGKKLRAYLLEHLVFCGLLWCI